MPLKNIKVIELAGLAPGPFCGMILSDFGASVTRVDKINANVDFDALSNGKKSVSLDLKHPRGAEVFRRLCKNSDVLIEPFRTGVMEKLGLGPEVLLKDNPKLIYARLTGYGQFGALSARAGHDINYTAISGLLSLFGRKGTNPFPPINFVADFAGGGLTCALGILLALLERHRTGNGQVVDNSMVNGAAYVGSWLFRTQKLPLWGQARGENILDSGAHFYDVYETKDGKFMAVGAIEPQFYAELIKGLGFTEDQAPQYGDFPTLKALFKKKFLEKSQDEWCHIFDETDACVTPVLSLKEASMYPHNQQQSAFTVTEEGIAPNPAPSLSRTPGQSQYKKKSPIRGEHTREVLKDVGFSVEEIGELVKVGVVESVEKSKL